MKRTYIFFLFILAFAMHAFAIKTNDWYVMNNISLIKCCYAYSEGQYQLRIRHIKGSKNYARHNDKYVFTSKGKQTVIITIDDDAYDRVSGDGYFCKDISKEQLSQLKNGVDFVYMIRNNKIIKFEFLSNPKKASTEAKRIEKISVHPEKISAKEQNEDENVSSQKEKLLAEERETIEQEKKEAEERLRIEREEAIKKEQKVRELKAKQEEEDRRNHPAPTVLPNGKLKYTSWRETTKRTIEYPEPIKLPNGQFKYTSWRD